MKKPSGILPQLPKWRDMPNKKSGLICDEITVE